MSDEFGEDYLMPLTGMLLAGMIGLILWALHALGVI